MSRGRRAASTSDCTNNSLLWAAATTATKAATNLAADRRTCGCTFHESPVWDEEVRLGWQMDIHSSQGFTASGWAPGASLSDQQTAQPMSTNIVQVALRGEGDSCTSGESGRAQLQVPGQVLCKPGYYPGANSLHNVHK
jgi:hypothetical protein